MTEDWGVPDWRNADAYPQAHEINSRQWWWEFTRRNNEYRALWREWAPKHAARVDRDYHEYEKLAKLANMDTISFVEYYKDRAVTNMPDYIRRKFSVSVIVNPTKVHSDWEIRHFFYSPGVCAVHGNGDGFVKVEDGRLLISFNLSLPLEYQIEQARRMLISHQEDEEGRRVIERHRRTNWHLFLRAIDARDANATFAEMARTFWPDQDGSQGASSKTPQSARDLYRAACELRENPPL